MTRHPWPLSELADDEAAALLDLPPKLRAARIEKLKRDLLGGERARQAERRAFEERLRDG